MPHNVFINLVLSQKLKKRLSKLIKLIQKYNPNFKSFESSLHCTFVFIGDLPDMHVIENIKSSLMNMNSDGENFKIKLEKCSILGRQTVILLSVPDELKTIQEKLNDKFGMNDSQWIPHISIGRGDIPSNINDIESEFNIKLNLELRGIS